jgi:hypothetical protein
MTVKEFLALTLICFAVSAVLMSSFVYVMTDGRPFETMARIDAFNAQGV